MHASVVAGVTSVRLLPLGKPSISQRINILALTESLTLHCGVALVNIGTDTSWHSFVTADTLCATQGSRTIAQGSPDIMS